MCSKLNDGYSHVYVYEYIWSTLTIGTYFFLFLHYEFLELMITERQLLFACAMFSHLVIVNNCCCKHVLTTRVYMMLGRES